MKTAPWRTVTVCIDCPTPLCGGGLQSSVTGSFMLEATDLQDYAPGDKVVCDECLQRFRLPSAPFRALGRK